MKYQHRVLGMLSLLAVIVAYFGNYTTPFIPMVAWLALGSLLWLQVDPTRELFPDAPVEPTAVAPDRW